jgi:TolB-like protein/DNA-binding winged helix-turn-helix (wHTH) protein/Tfp pilus assembly protein PilF
MSQPIHPLYEFGPYRLDPAQQLLSEGQRRIPLTPKAFQTLLVLVKAQGRVVGKDELLRIVWPDTFVEEATLAQNVFTLRKQLEKDSGTNYIETIPKRGYRFVAPVRIEDPPARQELTAPISPSINDKPRTWRRRLGLLGAIVLVAITFLLYRFGNSKIRTKPSGRVMLAVLPVQNLTGNAAQEYLVDGITEEVIANLGSANPSRLGVIARTSSMAYKDTKKTVRDIGKELHVDYVLESSLRESSGQMRFTAQLIHAQDQTHVWAHSYDYSLKDVLSLQNDLATAVTAEIPIGLPPESLARLSSAQAVQPQAYDAYLRGRFFWNKRTAPTLTTARIYFQQAIEIDPNFALGYAGLSDCYQVMVNVSQITPADGFSLARAAALKALELNNRLAEAHTSMASIEGDVDWNWQGAEAEYRRALELNPNYVTARHWYGDFLAGLGRFDESESEIRKARELDPLAPVIGVTLAQLYCRTGRCELGLEELSKTLEMYPDFTEAHEARAEIYAHVRRYEESMAEMKKAGQLPEGHAMLLSGYAAARAGRRQEALNALHEFENDTQFVHGHLYLAILYAALGDKDTAFARLERARQGHDPFMPYFRADFKLEALQSDPRYAELCRRMKMLQ